MYILFSLWPCWSVLTVGCKKSNLKSAVNLTSVKSSYFSQYSVYRADPAVQIRDLADLVVTVQL